jgi:hypothetical protein
VAAAAMREYDKVKNQRNRSRGFEGAKEDKTIGSELMAGIDAPEFISERWKGYRYLLHGLIAGKMYVLCKHRDELRVPRVTESKQEYTPKMNPAEENISKKI